MEDPTNRFGQVVGGINNTRNVNKYNTTLSFPVLNGKILNINKLDMFSRNSLIDNYDSGSIIFVYLSRTITRELKFFQYRTYLQCNFRTKITARYSASVLLIAVTV